MLLSKGKKFTLVQETQAHHKFLNASNCEIVKVSPRKEGNTKLQMKNVEGDVLFHIDFRPSESSFALCGAKRDVSSSEKKIIAVLKTKVENGNRFSLFVKEEKYGSDKQVEFSSDGEFSVKHLQDDRPFCIFQSNGGPVGVSGGIFRISGGQRRNFTLGIVSLVFLMQEEAHKGAKTKGTGFYFEDPSQKSALPSRTQKSQPNLPMLVFPISKDEDSVTRPKTTRAEIVTVTPKSNRKGDTEEEPSMLSPQGKNPRRAFTHSGGSPKGVSRNAKKLPTVPNNYSKNDFFSESEIERDTRMKKQLPKRLHNSGEKSNQENDFSGEPHLHIASVPPILSTTSPRSPPGISPRILPISIPTNTPFGGLVTSPRGRTISALTPGNNGPVPTRGRTSSETNSNVSPRAENTKISNTSPSPPYWSTTPKSPTNHLSNIPSSVSSPVLGSINISPPGSLLDSAIISAPVSSPVLGSTNFQANISPPGSSPRLGFVNVQSNISPPGSSPRLSSANNKSNISSPGSSPLLGSTNNQSIISSPGSAPVLGSTNNQSIISSPGSAPVLGYTNFQPISPPVSSPLLGSANNKSNISSPGSSSLLGSTNNQSNISSPSSSPSSSPLLGSTNNQSNITPLGPSSLTNYQHSTNSPRSLAPTNNQSTTNSSKTSPLGFTNYQSSTPSPRSPPLVVATNHKSPVTPTSPVDPGLSPGSFSITSCSPRRCSPRRSPATVLQGKGLSVDSYVKCWEQLDAIAGDDKFT